MFVLIGILSGLVVLLISEIISMRSRIEYLERRYVAMNSDIKDLYIALREVKNNEL